MNNNNNTNSNTNSNATRLVYVDRHGNVQQPRPQQRMQRPQPMQRPKPLDVRATVLSREEQERKRIVRSLPPAWAEVAVGSAELPCVMGCTGLLLTKESVGWLNQLRRHDVVPVAVTPAVTAAAPVATPVATTVAKPSYRRDSGRAKRKVRAVEAKRKARLVEVDAPWLDPKEASRALVESMAWIDRSNAKWTATKAQLARVGMIKSAKEPTPAGLLAGPGLSFRAAHELLRRRHVVEDAGEFLILSQEAMKDPLSPWRTRIDLGSLVAAAAREAQEEVSALERAARVRRELIRSEAQVAAELRAEAQAIVDEELRREAEEAAMLADAEDTALEMVVQLGWTEKKFNLYMSEWKKARAIQRVKARMAELEKSKAAAKPDLVEERRADIGEYAAFKAAWKPKHGSGISRGRSEWKPANKGAAKAVSKRDVGVVVDPYMVREVDHAEQVADKRQVADLIGPKVVARRVR